MNDMKRAIAKHPYIFSIAVFVANALLAVPFVVAFKMLNFDIEPLRLVIPVAQSVFNIGILYYLGWLYSAGFGTRIQNIQLLLFPLAIAFFPVVLFGTVKIDPANTLFYILALIFTGVSEESEARALILKAMLPKGIWVALLFMGLLFSIGHFSNLVFEDFSPFQMAEKLLVTFGFAILYGAIYLRTLNIWPLIILHFIHDFMFLISGTAGPYEVEPLPAEVHLFVGMLSILYGIYLVRHTNASSVINEMESLKR